MQHFIMICFSAKVDHPLIFSSKWAFYCFSSKFHFNWMFSKQCSFSSPSFVCTQMFIRLTQTNAFDANAPETFFRSQVKWSTTETPERKNQFPKNAFWKYSKNFWLKDIELRRSCGHGQVGCLVRPYFAACQPSLPGFYGEMLTY